jgi:hypothetical protein
MEKLKN